jgi:hypothetical protein
MARRQAKDEADRRLGWGFTCFGFGVTTVVGLALASPIQLAWALYSALIFAGGCFFLAAYFFGWLTAPDLPGVAPTIVATLAVITGAMVLLYFLVSPRPPANMLTMKATTGYLSHPVGQIFGGVKWEESFVDVRLEIRSKAEFPIQDLDLTIAVVPHKALLGGLGQLSNVSGCQITLPKMEQSSSLRIRGLNGGVFTLDTKDYLNEIRYGDYYKIFCSRLPGREELRLVVAACNDSSEHAEIVTPKILIISGTYETMPSEGSHRVEVNQVLPVIAR